jgi:hypothetical protein
MTIDRDLETTRLVRSWLNRNEHESADRILDTVLALLDATPQHRPLPVRRFANMNSSIKLAIAAAAVLVVALVGINVIPRSGGNVGGSAASPSQPPSSSPSPSASPSSSPARDTWPPHIEAVVRNDVIVHGIPFSFRVPSSGWRTFNVGPGGVERGTYPTDGYGWIGFMGRPTQVGTDPCTGASRPIPQDLTEAANAYTTIPGTHAEAPKDVTVGGRPAKLVVLTIDPDIACLPNQFWLFGEGSMYPDTTKSIIRSWLFELDGTLYEIDSEQSEPNADLDQEIQLIVDSVKFD